MFSRYAQRGVIVSIRGNALTHSGIHRSTYCHSSPKPANQTLPVSKRPGYDIKMLYDGECPLCMREVNMLQRRDEKQRRIEFVDIASPEYQPADNADISFEEAMGEIHAVLPSGKVVKNIEVFQRLYDIVGLGWIYGFTKYEPLRRAADAVYSIWARYRLPLTGRSDLSTVMTKRKQKSCR